MKNGEAPNLSPTHLATYKPGPYCATCGSIKVIRQRGAMLYRCKTMGKGRHQSAGRGHESRFPVWLGYACRRPEEL